jgi:REP element-mobilizing transposase RayT
MVIVIVAHRAQPQKMKTVYKNRLPHIAPIGATFFITFRLGDSLPRSVTEGIKAELEMLSKAIQLAKGEERKRYYNAYKRCYVRYDSFMDKEGYGACYLKQSEIASIVKDKLHELDGTLYDLQAYCIMPNHVHLLIDTMEQLKYLDDDFMANIPEGYVQLDKIMKRIKGSTARYANLKLGRTGTFWQKDSYDHYVRNEREWNNILSYILNNPVKAGLAKDWEAWPHTFCKYP